MEDFIVSARKYRPQEFDSVIGQSHVTNTLYNAIRTNQLAHALLFTGPRGVGKTTCARIVAKMINQTSDEDTTDYSLNILELDAASNNSVDDIRQLNDQVRFAPNVGKYKVYIVDEVHMLSQSAFNAFLKTLEEPPAHVKFVLATTEKHKILPTILSRCQVYDFKRISINEIVSHLQKVSQKENIIAENQALHMIAEKADGAMRDALSIFDRVVSFSGKNLTYKAVIENLNILDYDYYFKIVDALLKSESRETLLIFNEILENGHDGQIFINGLASHLRDLLVATDQRTYKLLKVSEEVKDKYFDQARYVSPNQIFKSLKLLSDADFKFKSSNNQQLLVELTLLQLIPIFASAKKPEQKKNKSIESSKSDEVEEQRANPSQTRAEEQESIHYKNEVEETTKDLKSEPVEQQDSQNYDVEQVVVENQAEKPTQSVARKERRSLFSINENIKASDTEEEVTEVIQPKKDKPLEISEIIEIWNDFANQLETNKDKLPAAMMRRCKPTLSGNLLLLEFETITQQNFFRDIRQQLTDLMRNTLENDYLDFEVSIVEPKESPVQESQSDMLKKQIQQYPLIAKVIEDFKLDPDFL